MSIKNKQEQRKDAFQRMLGVLKEKGIRPPDFQRKLGVESQNWTNWRTRGLPSDRYFEISGILGICPSWLATGEGDKYIAIRNTNSNGHGTFKLAEAIRVPVMCKAQLIDNGHWHKLECHIHNSDGYINYLVHDKGAYALRHVGDSMKPRLRDDEFVIVEPNREAQPGDDVVLYSLDGYVMVKIFLYTRGGRVHLMSINEAHPPQSFALEEIDKIHPIVGIANNLSWVKD